MRVALDTNILAYAEGVNGAAKKRAALEILEKLPEGAVLLPVQVLGELFNLLVRKAKRSRAKARRAILSWNDAFPVVETSEKIMVVAADLARNHQLSIWDSVVLTAAAESGCRLLLSEDLQDGFSWHGVTVTNPFSSPQDELLAGLLAN
ncbi:MAG TPA: PIN domain-containing protein [Candidatus Acidoferrales bacterium]|nr:PIN domain-containing protein [Candidatus Acidoferrales bacterium]